MTSPAKKNFLKASMIKKFEEEAEKYKSMFGGEKNG